MRLTADIQAQAMSESNADYNCFAYAKSFITGALPFRQSDLASFSSGWLTQQGFPNGA
jgi:hypothetical protein